MTKLGSSRSLFFALLLLTGCRRAESPIPVTASRGPVILISIDTLRSDHLPAYGYEGVKTPAIDALRADGVLYATAWSHCPMTLPSHASILTGLLPYEHGVRNNVGYALDAAKHDSLPAMLKREGYATGAAVSAYVLRRETGIGPLFDFYDDRMSDASGAGMGEVSRDGARTAEIASRWIAGRGQSPFFFLLHLFEPHWPYEGSYDQEIARADAILGTFIAALKSSGVYDRATIILLSDHGEGLGDHGEGEHGVFLYREALQVPLIVKLPRSERRGTTVATPAQLIDVAPTIAALTGAKPRVSLAGKSLLDLPAEPREIYSESMLPRIHFGWSELRSLFAAPHHFIDAPRAELYDTSSDPRERTNIAATERRTFAILRSAMQKRPAAFTAPSAVDPEEAGKLAALGYIGQVLPAPGELPDPKDRIAELEALKAGAALQRRGELAAAASRYEAIVAENPRFADAWLRLAAVQERLGRVEPAVQSYRHAIEAAPVLAAQAALPLSSLYLSLGRLDEAASHAELAMSNPLYRDGGGVMLARIQLARGRLQEAMRVLDSVSPTTRDRESTRGEILAMMDRGEDAERAFLAELRAHPQNTDAQAKLAILYFAMGRKAESDAVLSRMPPELAKRVRVTLQ